MTTNTTKGNTVSNTATKTKPKTALAAKRKPAAPKAATPPPEPPKPADHGSITMLASDLKRIIAVVSVAASTDEARPILCNISIELHADGTSDWVATDSYRLHIATLRPTDGVTAEAAGQIPARWLQRWARTPLRRTTQATLSWATGDNGMRTATISADGMTDTINIGREYGAFPHWRWLIPGGDVAGSMAPAAFNPRYLAACLAAHDKWTDSGWRPVRIEPLKPSLFESIHDEHGHLRTVLMPVRVG